MSWTTLPLPKGTGILAVHAALLPSGEKGQVLILGGNEHFIEFAEHKSQRYRDRKASLYDVAQEKVFLQNVPTPESDVFCCGHAFAGDGNLVIGGGTAFWRGNGGHQHDHGSTYPDFAGETKCWKFVRNAAGTWQWAALGDFQASIVEGDKTYKGRWYPAMFTLHTGQVIAFSGRTDKPGQSPNLNNTPEVLGGDGVETIWKPLPQSSDIELGMYVRGHVMRDGQVLLLNVKSLLDGSKVTAVCRPSTGKIQKIADFAMTSKVYDEWTFASTLLPLLHKEGYAQQVLVCNDLLAHIFDYKTKTWSEAPPRHADLQGTRRRHGCATLLPNGKVFVNGGINSETGDLDNDANYVAEIFDPGIDWVAGKRSGAAQWAKADRASVVRNYHSVALLLPDGTVWTAGSSRNANSGNPKFLAQRAIEIYRPDYCYIAGRLRIQSLSATKLTYTSGSFDIVLENEGEVSAVVLTRCGSSTHAGNFDQRLVSLAFQQQGKTLRVVTCKKPKIALPGHYLCWVLDQQGVPCEWGHFIQIIH